MKTNLKSLVASSVLAVSLLSNNFAYAGVVGGDGSGGGNIGLYGIDSMVELVGANGENLKKEMLKLVKLLSLTPRNQTYTAPVNNLLFMIQNGLEKDIRQSNYILTDKCFNENGENVDASTKKVNLAINTNQQSPDVCINIKNLVNKNAKFMPILSLMFHEHARHFGFEDTDQLGRHPISQYVLEKSFAVYDWKMTTFFYNTNAENIILDENLNGVTQGKLLGENGSERLLIVTDEKQYSLQKFFIEINEISVGCKKVSFFNKKWKMLTVGSKYEIEDGNYFQYKGDRSCSISFSLQNELNQFENLKLNLGKNLEKNTPIITFLF